MPYKPRNPCRHPGCHALTYNRYCEAHISNYRRDSASKRGRGSKWQRLSSRYLREHPLCAECQRHGRLTAASVVDHIIPHRGNDKLMWTESNWAASCKPCHDRKTGRYDSQPTYSYNK